MIPWEIISESFTIAEARLLQGAGYNLNDGINLIILPCFEQVGLILGTFTHPNDHPGYTSDLLASVRLAKAEISGDEDEHATSETIGNVRSLFEAWEKAEWWVIIAAGQLAAGTHIKDYLPTSMVDALASI
jgi:hypothetical protein